MTRPIVTASKIGTCFGFVIALLVLTYGYLLPRTHSRPINELLIFIACPPSFILMAVDNGKWWLFLLADSIVVVANTVWYGMLFEGVAMLFRHRSKVSISTEGE